MLHAIEMENDMEKTETPTQVEHKHRGWKAMPFIIGNETFEKLGTTGTSANLMVYLISVFNMKSISAALLINVWSATTNVATVVGAFLCDAYFGRYAVIGVACVASFLGMLLIMLTSLIPSLHPRDCGGASDNINGGCKGPTPAQLAFLYFALGFLVIGAGGIRPCSLAFGVDQFNPHSESGKRGITSFFNWYYFTFTFGVMIAMTAIVYVQVSISWTLGLALPTGLMLIACVLFFAGTRIYVKVHPEGSPFTSIFQVITASLKKRGLQLPEQDHPETSLFNPVHKSSLIIKLPYTDQFRCLDKAAIITSEDAVNDDGSARNPWGLCSLQQVEELKCLIRVIPIWFSGVLHYIGNAQESTYVVLQALQSDRRLGLTGFHIPAGSFPVFNMIALTIWIPIYDRVVVPSLRRITGKDGGITLLQRMGVGIILSVVSMTVSGMVEKHRRNSSFLHGNADASEGGGGGGSISTMSAFWLIPQLIISGLSEAFNTVAHLEFYYKQFPENMRSVGGSLFFLAMAGTGYLSGLLVEVVHATTKGEKSWLPEDLNHGRLENFYFLIAVIEVFNFFLFLVFAKWYRYKATAQTAHDQQVALQPTHV